VCAAFCSLLMLCVVQSSELFPYTTLFRSNPSHLEAVGPVVQGMVRSRIDSVYKGDFNKAAGIIIHGDAAIAAQGIVYEAIQMSRSEEHTSELQSRENLVCRLLLEQKNGNF